VRLQNWFYKYNAWSFTKHRLWKDCKLAYYFSYIGTAISYHQTINANELKRLKKLDSRFIVQGKIVHDIIEQEIGNYQNGKVINEQSIRSQYIEQIEEYRKNAHNKIVEYINGETIKQAFFDRIRENGLDQLDLFFGVIWPEFEDRKYLRHEKFDRFSTKNVPVIVKVDYASADSDGSILVSDWKTGIDSEEYENDLQIGAYVLWATEYYKITPDKVSSELVYLTTGRRAKHSFSKQQLLDIENLIVDDFKLMNESYEMDQFMPNPNPENCIRCHFSSVCTHSLTNEYLE